MEVIGRRLQGVISERSKSFSSRIRFSESSLSLLVDGVESCHRQEVKRKFVKRFFFFFLMGESLSKDGRRMEENYAWRVVQMEQAVIFYAWC